MRANNRGHPKWPLDDGVSPMAGQMANEKVWQGYCLLTSDDRGQVSQMRRPLGSPHILVNHRGVKTESILDQVDRSKKCTKMTRGSSFERLWHPIWQVSRGLGDVIMTSVKVHFGTKDSQLSILLTPVGVITMTAVWRVNETVKFAHLIDKCDNMTLNDHHDDTNSSFGMSSERLLCFPPSWISSICVTVSSPLQDPFSPIAWSSPSSQ